ncbi:MAG: protein kinase [Pirellula sp.]|nr:protein kinase [Pirellula sp.]
MAKPIDHPSKEKLAAFSVGLLAIDEASLVESHIGECTPCCETLLSLSAEDTFVGLLQQTDDNGSFPLEECCSLETILANHPRYRVLHWIARGGMGDVFLAEHRGMGRTVAVKVIHRKFVRTPSFDERFQREVRTAARLIHPNIVTAYDSDQFEGMHFLVMEYVDGCDLATLIKERQSHLSITEACDYICQAAAGLQYAHEQGIIHRDIKPHNLMVSNGAVKILDFGLASLSDADFSNSDVHEEPIDLSLTTTGAIMGTPDFMSPEQASHLHRVDLRSDIYSLGATLYYLLAGKAPFSSGGSVSERLRQLASDQPQSIRTLREDVPKELSDIIDRMLAKSPADRFQSVHEAAVALRPFAQSGFALQSETPAPSVAASRGNGVRSRWPAILTATAALMGLALAGIIYLETDKGTLVIESVDDTVKVVISQGRDPVNGTYLKNLIVDTVTGSEVKRLPSGEYTLSLAKEGNEFQLNQDGFVLKRGDKIVAKVTRKPTDNSVKETAESAIALKEMPISKTDQMSIPSRGNRLTEEQVKALQVKIDSDPNDIESRLILMGYYYGKSILDPQFREPHGKLVLWLIQNYPASDVAGTPYASFHAIVNPEGFVSGKNLWMEIIKHHGSNTKVLLNAANYFLLQDKAIAEELLKKAEALEPESSLISKRLAHLYKLAGASQQSKAKSEESALKAKAQLEATLASSAEGAGKSRLLIDLSKVELQLGNLARATEIAKSMLEKYSDADSIHAAHQILGRIALREDRIEEAQQHLLDSARIKGSPVLMSFGPSMILAKELLEKDRKDAVLEYFELCGQFWTMGGKRLKDWREAIQNSRSPDFGISVYQ